VNAHRSRAYYARARRPWRVAMREDIQHDQKIWSSAIGALADVLIIVFGFTLGVAGMYSEIITDSLPPALLRCAIILSAALMVWRGYTK